MSDFQLLFLLNTPFCLIIHNLFQKMNTPSKKPRMLHELSTGGTHRRTTCEETKKPHWQNLEGTKIDYNKRIPYPTNIVIPTTKLFGAIDGLTCLPCSNKSVNEQYEPISKQLTQKGGSVSIKLECSKGHLVEIASQTLVLDGDTKHFKSRWKEENLLMCCGMLATGSGIEDMLTISAFMGLPEPSLRYVVDYIHDQIINVSEDVMKNLKEEIHIRNRK